MKTPRIQPAYSHGPFSLQTVVEEMFYNLIEGQYGDTKLISSGIPHAKVPTLVKPIMVFSNRFSLGLHRGSNTMTLYLFSRDIVKDLPAENSVLLEIKCGMIESVGGGRKEFRNIICMGKAMKKIRIEKNQSKAIYWVIGEMNRILDTGKYLQEKNIPEEYILTINPFREEDFQDTPPEPYSIQTHGTTL